MFSLHILEKGERLTQRPQRALHACLAVRFGGRVFRFEERADGLCDVLDDAQHLLRNVFVLLERFECLAKRFTSSSCHAR